MAELQKLSTYQLNDLPEEVILKVLEFLNIKELLLCGQVSQRLRAISKDGSLWRKLQVLNMTGYNIIPWNLTSLLQDLFINCTHLTELNICGYRAINTLLVPHIQALVDNLTPTILKVSLSHQNNLTDEHVKKMVERCNKITHVDLSWTQITNNSVQSIIKHLDTTLEKLDLSLTKVDFAGLLELKCIPTLKALVCKIGVNGIFGYFDSNSIENLKKQLPNISITDESFHIASPF